MSFRGTAILGLVFAALLGWVLVVELAPVPPPPTFDTLLPVSPERVTKLVITRDGRTTSYARMATDEWLDQQGRSWPTARIDALLIVLTALRPLSRIEPEPGETGRYGLDHGRIQAFLGDGTAVLDLELGNANPSETALYARTTGQPTVLLVGSLLRWELSKLEIPPVR